MGVPLKSERDKTKGYYFRVVERRLVHVKIHAWFEGSHLPLTATVVVYVTAMVVVHVTAMVVTAMAAY